MGLVAEYEVGCEALPLTDVARAVPAATLTVQMVPNAAGHSPFVVRVHEGPADAVAAAFETSDFVAEYTDLGPEGETCRYQVIPAPSIEAQLGDHVDDVEGLRALASEDAAYDRLEVLPDGWRYTGWFADRATFDAFREFWQREGQPFRLLRLAPDDGTAGRGHDSSDDALTDRQREAARTAHELGYFDVPRGATLAEVADELGITASSCSERLRRAQTQLVERHVDPARPARRRETPPRHLNGPSRESQR
jgi:hypothetical protein